MSTDSSSAVGHMIVRGQGFGSAPNTGIRTSWYVQLCSDGGVQQLRLRLLTYETTTRRLSNTRDDERLDRLAYQVARHLIFRDKEGIVVTSHLRMPLTSRLFSGIWSP